MDGFHKRKKRYKFTEKKHSKRGIAAVVIATISIVVFLVYIMMSYRSQSGISLYMASGGVLAMVASVFNLILVINGMREENSFQLFPRLGLLLTIVSLVLWGGIYIQGFMA